MSQTIPRILVIGAGNIALSIIKGIIKIKPETAGGILAVAPTDRNLKLVRNLGCQTMLLDEFAGNPSSDRLKPEIALLCVKPQVLWYMKDNDKLNCILRRISAPSVLLSVVSGFKLERLLRLTRCKVVRFMINTACEFNASSILYYHFGDLDQTSITTAKSFFSLISESVVKLSSESLMDVSTGVCGSGIAFFYEMIQATSDVGVKNGLTRSDSLQVAAELSVAAGRMILAKKEHPYKLRDDVTSPSGTTIYGLSEWHEKGVNIGIASAFQASIDRAKFLAD